MKDLRIRIKDLKVIKKLQEIKNTFQFKSDNELGNFLIEKGLNTFNGASKENSFDIDENTKKKINYIKMSIDEMYVTLNIIKHLVATIYNIKLEEIDGDSIDRDLIESGALSNLPERLAEIENSITKKMEMERRKNG